MIHQAIQMAIKPYIELEVLEDIVEVTCPTCNRSFIDYERNVIFRPYTTICEGFSESIKQESIVDSDIPF